MGMEEEGWMVVTQVYRGLILIQLIVFSGSLLASPPPPLVVLSSVPLPSSIFFPPPFLFY